MTLRVRAAPNSAATARSGLATETASSPQRCRRETRETPPTPLFREELYVENTRTFDERRRCGARDRRRHAYYAGDIVGLITKTNTNPFFVKMKEGFEAKAKELGLTPQAYAGKFDGDNDGEVKAIEQLIAAGAKGILLVPSDSTAIVPTVKKARDAGILVITLDTPLDPVDAADACSPPTTSRPAS